MLFKTCKGYITVRISAGYKLTIFQQAWLNQSDDDDTVSDLELPNFDVSETQQMIKQERHLYLCDVRQSNNVWNKANSCNEELSAVSENTREFINQCSDEAFHGAELERLQSHDETMIM